MRIRFLAFLAMALALFVAPSWAQSCGGEETNCFTFDSTHTTFTYSNFGGGDTSSLTFSFETVLVAFDLRVGVSHPLDSNCGIECTPTIALDPNEFPPGTVCVPYPSNGTGVCDQYDFTGNASGPHGVPVKNKNYKGLITLTLSYDSPGTAHNPAFGHAPGDITTIFRGHLDELFRSSISSDPTMGGKTPGLSSVVAFDKPFHRNCAIIFVA